MRSLKIASLLLLIASAGFGWTPKVDHRIASKASQLAPPDMKILIDKYDESYRRGIIAALEDESRIGHHYFVDSGSGRLREMIEKEVAEAVVMVRKRQPFEQFVEKLGVISHLVADANNPLHVANSDPRLEASHKDFEFYLEKKSAVVPTVFYGLANNFNLPAYLDGVFRRAASLYPLLSEEYFRFGERRSSNEFDDRSTAFGVAALSYSHSVTDLVNIYYHIWKQAGGDVRNAAALRKGNLLLTAEAP